MLRLRCRRDRARAIRFPRFRPGAAAFSSAVSFGCSGLPALTSCGFSPATIAAGAGTTPVTLTIATMGPNLGTESQPRIRAVLRTAWAGEGDRSYGFILMVVVGIVGLGVRDAASRVSTAGSRLLV